MSSVIQNPSKGRKVYRQVATAGLQVEGLELPAEDPSSKRCAFWAAQDVSLLFHTSEKGIKRNLAGKQTWPMGRLLLHVCGGQCAAVCS